MNKVAILGCGAMGSAVARALVQQLVVSADNLLLVEKLEERGRELAESLEATHLPAPTEELTQMSVLVLAVKPQDAKTIAESLLQYLKPDQLVVSLMAGVTLARLQNLLGGHVKLVRSMPNLPAQCGEGVTVYCSTQALSPSDAEFTARLFESFGRSLRIADEKLLDAATALSGTGPAYFFYLAAEMTEAAEKFGFSSQEAKLLVEQTMLGAALLWKQSALSPRELVSRVASRGGTTEAALKVLAERNSSEAWQAAIEAACRRSKELSQA